mgnify:CR=1 FL=1
MKTPTGVKVGFLAVLACAALAQSASAQDIPRIKARILAFDGKTLSLTSGTAGQSLSVGLIPTTRLMYEEKIDPAALKPGDYAGATLVKNGTRWQAKEVRLVSTPAQSVQLDGEVLGTPAVSARVLPQAIRVLTPGPAAGSGKPGSAAGQAKNAPGDSSGEPGANQLLSETNRQLR